MKGDVLIFFIALALIFITILSSINYYTSYYQSALAHMPISNTSRIQDWTDSHSGVDIQFTYEPEKPIIDRFTELKFSVQNATTGEHITDNDDAVARIIVTNGQRLFKFENISVGNDGHFSVKYLFPDDGTHQALMRLDTKDSSTLSSFNVFVPHQSPPSILNPFPSSPTMTGPDNNQRIVMTAILGGIIGSIVIATVILIKRR
jgi:hypothetical protein